mmetsp:Transcript_8275/g.27526  ORF Transcript_8275/g.27526 Transcript_8275/m.27526 type:complete len:244 (-) Transcript_8275:3315-4046(-)
MTRVETRVASNLTFNVASTAPTRRASHALELNPSSSEESNTSLNNASSARSLRAVSAPSALQTTIHAVLTQIASSSPSPSCRVAKRARQSATSRVNVPSASSASAVWERSASFNANAPSNRTARSTHVKGNPRYSSSSTAAPSRDTATANALASGSAHARNVFATTTTPSSRAASSNTSIAGSHPAPRVSPNRCNACATHDATRSRAFSVGAQRMADTKGRTASAWCVAARVARARDNNRFAT